MSVILNDALAVQEHEEPLAFKAKRLGEVALLLRKSVVSKDDDLFLIGERQPDGEVICLSIGDVTGKISARGKTWQGRTFVRDVLGPPANLQKASKDEGENRGLDSPAPAFLSHRLALVADQLAELAALAASPLSPLGKECLSFRQQGLAVELALLAHLAGLAAQESVLATAQTGGEAAA